MICLTVSKQLAKYMIPSDILNEGIGFKLIHHHFLCILHDYFLC